MSQSHNLALLPSDEKQAIEVDKQAAYDVWKVQTGDQPEFYLEQQKTKFNSEQELAIYVQGIEKYKKMPA